ncbi:hypothetical protein [Sphingomonas sp. GM_Shp_1]|uniref:hypothetical protein n=1 Tax=Sphingomonas sp. GM_Shp_1 TaxID=2937381 RepID=UPI00226BB96A|nr:hypothetical protein [Sphingomonas sp. GM_Shp_1]
MDIASEVRSIASRSFTRHIDDIQPETVIAKLGVDYIDIACVAIDLEDRLGIELSHAELVRLEKPTATIADLIGMVERAKVMA